MQTEGTKQHELLLKWEKDVFNESNEAIQIITKYKLLLKWEKQEDVWNDV